uniref:Uncharacterized protein n=1 Tax=Setaria viridis TaxID=4556 RepID=A0A4U6T5A9_SETVI|nr:hypothetical protein SEVIR_9G462250v2 [Setaria viridis]
MNRWSQFFFLHGFLLQRWLFTSSVKSFWGSPPKRPILYC